MLARLFAEIPSRTRRFLIWETDLSNEPVAELPPAAMSVSAETRVYGDFERTVPIACDAACHEAFGMTARQGLLITASTCLIRLIVPDSLPECKEGVTVPIPDKACLASLVHIGKAIASTLRYV